jgi:hypothetical protein
LPFLESSATASSADIPGSLSFIPIRVRLSHNALTDSELKRKKVRIMC